MEFFVHSDYPFVKITFIDVALLIIYSVLILIFAYFYQKKKVESNQVYQFYTLGLFVKLLGGMIFAFIYLFVYEGDTLDYFNSAICLYNLMIKNFSQFWEIMVNGGNLQNFSYFDIKSNPTSESFELTVKLLSPGFVSLKLYDQLGNTIETIFNGFLESGIYNYGLQIQNKYLSSGLYFINLSSTDFNQTKPLIIMK